MDWPRSEADLRRLLTHSTHPGLNPAMGASWVETMVQLARPALRLRELKNSAGPLPALGLIGGWPRVSRSFRWPVRGSYTDQQSREDHHLEQIPHLEKHARRMAPFLNQTEAEIQATIKEQAEELVASAERLRSPRPMDFLAQIDLGSPLLSSGLLSPGQDILPSSWPRHGQLLIFIEKGEADMGFRPSSWQGQCVLWLDSAFSMSESEGQAAHRAAIENERAPPRRRQLRPHLLTGERVLTFPWVDSSDLGELRSRGLVMSEEAFAHQLDEHRDLFEAVGSQDSSLEWPHQLGGHVFPIQTHLFHTLAEIERDRHATRPMGKSSALDWHSLIFINEGLLIDPICSGIGGTYISFPDDAWHGFQCDGTGSEGARVDGATMTFLCS